jgi:hypothetical protein
LQNVLDIHQNHRGKPLLGGLSDDLKARGGGGLEMQIAVRGPPQEGQELRIPNKAGSLAVMEAPAEEAEEHP